MSSEGEAVISHNKEKKKRATDFPLQGTGTGSEGGIGGQKLVNGSRVRRASSASDIGKGRNRSPFILRPRGIELVGPLSFSW